MIRNNYRRDAERIGAALDAFEAEYGALPGILDPSFREGLIDQIIDSEQRVAYFARLRGRTLDANSADPGSTSFDPLRASIIHAERGNYDEAVWLVFLFVHFGRHRLAGWRYVRDVYGRLGDGRLWDWPSVSADPIGFRYWLDDHQQELLAAPGPRGFSNHRKYESLNAWEKTGTGEAFESYVRWILSGGGDHAAFFAQFDVLDPADRFDALYRSMSAVARFGRIARFDYLTTLLKLELVQLDVPHSYLVGATGPLRGAQLLLRGKVGEGLARDLQRELQVLSQSIGIRGDVMEDAVCNWQKSPDAYQRFSG
ncbi:alpha-glutamyl/putrescinyl thymine pyrophosphorylase clade 3 protein [Microbacterium oleivorans]|uniref:Alpha-glutamyl/putrescinyl thymine pyrophosphorylase clade 3 domain-containing protein n=1 Tax=Microbacterium oleivorans TaxID=273677 RepID=A0A7D5EWX4_9MICO|nr:hypothetical protein [Microbacterium oleivorans]QLD11664.1 hypothetical protein HW566_07710 [Microbacterium oleivorans]